MLKNEDLVRAVTRFKNRPVYVKLVNELWPQVKDFDFRKGNNELRIQKPNRAYHETITHLEAGEGEEWEYNVQLIKLTMNYSHRAIRKVLKQWGLTVSNKFYIGGMLVIKKKR